MRRWLRFLVVLTMVVVPWAAGAQDIRIIPVPPGVKPQWTKVPGAPQVSWAPNIPTDVFRYQRAYYFYWEGYLYRGHTPQGPWKKVEKIPPAIYRLDPAYFKTIKKIAPTPAAPEGLSPRPGEIIEIPPAVPPEPPPPPPDSPASPEAPAPKVM